MGQALAQEHPCRCQGRSPGLPTYEPGLHCMSKKPGGHKPGGEGSFSLAYSGENAESSPRASHPPSLLGRLSLEFNLSERMHTRAGTAVYTHTAPRGSSCGTVKPERGTMYGERQQQPEEKDKQEQTTFPCIAFSVARAQMCSVCCLVLC